MPLQAATVAVMQAAPPTALAVEPDEVLADPVLEARARDISKELRCVVCQNQSIDDSNAELAKDLRIIVRERLVAGDDDQAVLDYLVDRYGDFVLYDPPFNARTYLIWLVPVGLAVLALVVLSLLWRRAQVRGDEEADGDLQRKAAAFLQEE